MNGEHPIVELRGLVKGYGRQVVLPGLDLEVREREFLILLGPSGCGKTTLLRLIAGFETPDSGEVFIDGQCVNGLPPNQRPVNTVFQSYALFPHLTVFDNVAFGLRMKKVGRQETRQRVEEMLALVQLEECTKRKPHQLSGGQQQRVALARAAINRPRVLLLDECLNALDYKLRQEMRVELRQWQRRLGLTFVFVTHDQEEALSLADRVAVMREGQIEQTGTPRQVYERPASLFAGRFVGQANLLDGRVEKRLDSERVVARVEGISCTLRADRPFVEGDQVKVLLRPEDVRLRLAGEREMLNGELAGRLVERTYKGRTLDWLIELDSRQQVTASQPFDEEPCSPEWPIGARVALSWAEGRGIALADE